MRIAGVILAGGRSSRFAGGSKEYALLLGRPLIAHVIERARPQVARLAISRAEAAPGEELGLTILTDRYKDRGPLAGLHSGLVWAASQDRGCSHLATFASDTPRFPLDLVERLHTAIGKSGVRAAMPICNGEAHPTLGLWSVDLEPLARRRLEEGPSSLKGFAEAAGATTVDFSDAGETAFFNVNTAEELTALAEKITSGAESPLPT
ncbi:MAG: molybdenum cofactor guanylyltransferase [Pseudomonadota bacterium]